jgi:hypothetical protein
MAKVSFLLLFKYLLLSLMLLLLLLLFIIADASALAAARAAAIANDTDAKAVNCIGDASEGAVVIDALSATFRPHFLHINRSCSCH